MIKILLCSNSSIKEQAVKKWLKLHLKETFKIDKHPVTDKLLPPQPMNSGGNLCCSDRIRNADTTIEISNYDYIISIESSLEISDDNLIDKVYVCIKNCSTNETFECNGHDFIIDYKIMDKYPLFLKVIEDLCKNYKDTCKKYIYDGCEMTLGRIINHYYPEIPDDNWMKVIYNKDRVNQIKNTLHKLTKKIKDDLIDQ